MNLDMYQIESRRTWNDAETAIDQIDNAVLGISGEAGEIADLWKKHRYQGHEFDAAKVADEIGDVLFYLARLADQIGKPLTAIADANISKLQRRYPDGFDAERSRNRRG